jgi:hypothetical protein
MVKIVACFPQAVTVEAIETSKGTHQWKNKCLLLVAGKRNNNEFAVVSAATVAMQ